MKVHNEILRTIARNCGLFEVPETDVYRAAGVSLESIQVQDGMQDWPVGVRMWDAALTLTGYPYISLSFGKSITMSVLGWIAPLASSSNTLGVALKSIADFFPLMGDMFEYELKNEADGGVSFIYRPSPVWEDYSGHTALLAVEHAMALTVSLSGFLCGKKVYTNAFFKQKTDEEKQSLYLDFFTEVQFNAAEYRIYFDRASIESPCISANPMVYQNVLEICKQQLDQIKRDSGVHSDVLRILNSLPAYQAPKIAEVAAMLNMSARTLQRKLQEENTTFHELLEQHQIETAQRLIQKADLQIQEIAFMLGFNSPQSFSKAYKRRTGKSPTQNRSKE